MLTKEQFTEAVKSAIEERSILKHPFYQKWNEGKLTLGELKEYAKQYYHFVNNFPMFVSSVHSNCGDADVRQMLVENLADEEGFKTNIADHPALWMNFCKALGLTENEVLNNKPSEHSAGMVEGFYSLCRSENYKTGLAALLGYEFQIPEVCKVKIEGLNKFYGIKEEQDIEFFSVHEKADIYHSRDELNALLEKCRTKEDQLNALEAVKKSSNLYWQMLDGIYLN